MKRGYIRPSGWCSREDQEATLIAAGVALDVIYVEGEIGNLHYAVLSLREGDELVVSSLDRIAGDRIALQKWMAEVRAKGAVILEAETGRRTDDAEQAVEMVLDALKRRGHKTEDAKRYGKMAKHSKRRAQVGRDEAFRIWRDEKYTRDEAAKLIGLSPTTCFRRYGKRGVPEGRPRTRGKK